MASLLTSHATFPDPPPACPVCRRTGLRSFLEVDQQHYWRCDLCQATSLDPSQRLCAAEELAHYRHHRNDPDDQHYRRFLSKLAGPLLVKLRPGMRGLDYGSGPGPALAAMFEEAGIDMTLHDPFFHPASDALEHSYDVITLSEVAEHLFDPASVFDQLASGLEPGGWLGVMTCFQTDDDRFASWHYRRDPTHVVFYRASTLQIVAEQRGLTCEIPTKDVALMQKSGAATSSTLSRPR